MGRTILIIDDEDMIREVAQLSLELAGYAVIAAGSGAEGLAMAAAQKPDGILLDVMMPEMDGPATFRALSADAATRDIPVVFLTAKVQSDRRELETLGVAGVLAKPFDPLALPAELAGAMGWRD